MKYILLLVVFGLFGNVQIANGQWTGEPERPMLVTDENSPLYGVYSDGENGFTVLLNTMEYSMLSKHFDAAGISKLGLHTIGAPTNAWNICKGPDKSVWSAGTDPSTGFPQTVRLDDKGKMIGSPTDLAEFWGTFTAITHDDQGGAFVFFCTPNSGMIYGSGVNADNTLKFVEPILYDDSMRINSPPHLKAIADGKGGAYYWYEYEQHLKLQRIGPDGKLTWNEPFDLSTSNSETGLRGVHADSAGGVYIVWSEDFKIQVVNISTAREIRRYSYANPLLNASTNWQSVTAPNGDLVLVYTVFNNYAEDFHLQRYSHDGVELLANPPLLFSSNEEHQFGLATAIALEDSFVYLARQYADLNMEGAFLVSKFDLNGVPQWSPVESTVGIPRMEAVYDRTMQLTFSDNNLALTWSYAVPRPEIWIQGLNKHGKLLGGLTVQTPSNFALEGFNFDGRTLVTAYDLVARVVYSCVSDQNELRRDLGALPNGKYLLRINGKTFHYSKF